MSVPSVSLPVQDTGTCATSCSNFFSSIREGFTSAGTWCGHKVQALGSTIVEYMQSAATAVKPHFDKMKEVIIANQQSIIVGVVCAAVGIIVTAVVNHFFCNNNNPAPAAPPAGAGG